MGLKRRSGSFTGTLKVAALRAVEPGEKLSKKELTARLRQVPNVGVTTKRVGLVIGKLLDEGRMVMEGQRANARFRRA